jgi:hypothetical protein
MRILNAPYLLSLLAISGAVKVRGWIEIFCGGYAVVARRAFIGTDFLRR